MIKTSPVADAVVEPVTVAEIKNHLRVTENDEDILIAGLITAARKIVEQYTRRALITQTFRLYLDEFPDSDLIELPYPPLISVSSVTYTDPDGVSRTLSPLLYQVDNRSTPGRILLSSDGAWPSTDDNVNAVTIEYLAGYGATGAAVPSPIRLAITHLVSHWFENREPYTTTQLQTVPHTFELILMPYRFLRLR